MRVRAGIVLIKDHKVALIERHRGDLHYFVFPGGGVDEGESPEQAAIREAMEELGVKVVIKQKVVEVYLGSKSRQIYFLVEQTGGNFGTGTGPEFTNPDADNQDVIKYLPVWMPLEELSWRDKVFPADVAKLVLKSVRDGWPEEAIIAFEESM